MKELLCAYCSRPITNPGSYKYCSPSCRVAWSNARRDEKYRAAHVPKPYQQLKRCQVCQAEFVSTHPAVVCCEIHRKAKKSVSTTPISCPICGQVTIRRIGATTCPQKACRLEYKRRMYRAKYAKIAVNDEALGAELISERAIYHCVSAPPEYADMIGEAIRGSIFQASLQVAALPPGNVYRIKGKLYKVAGDLAPFELCIRGASVTPQNLVPVYD